MIDFAVVADDFTGAVDIGIMLKKNGFSVKASVEETFSESEVIVYDTETRNTSSDYAEKIFRNYFDKYQKLNFKRLYKKVDSTLRGNIRAENEVILENLKPNEKIVFVMGFPDAGRKVVNGRIYVNDVPLNNSDFVNDPVNPVFESDIFKILGNGTIIGIDLIRGNLEEAIRKLSPEDKILIFDTISNADLEKIAKVLVKLKLDKYITGSAGLMPFISKYWKNKSDKIMIVSGSCNLKNIEQLNCFINEIGNEFDIIDIDFENENLNINHNFNKNIIIRSLKEKSDMYSTLENYMKRGLNRYEASHKISDIIASFSAEIIKKLNIRKIIVTGGETAVTLLKKLGIFSLKIYSEIEPGIVISFYEKDGYNYEIITKPGGFGTKKIFFSCYEKLKYVDKYNAK